MRFLSPDTIKTWTNTPFKKAQRLQLIDWGYKEGKDFWTRRDCSLAVKANLLQANAPVLNVTEPDFSCFDAAQAQNK